MTRTVVAEKPPVMGGVEPVIVSGNAPLFVTMKLSVAIAPTLTLLKLSDVGMKASWAGGLAEPDRGTPTFPTLVSRVAILSKTCAKLPEEPGGLKLTVKLTEALVANVPVVG